MPQLFTMGFLPLAVLSMLKKNCERLLSWEFDNWCFRDILCLEVNICGLRQAPSASVLGICCSVRAYNPIYHQSRPSSLHIRRHRRGYIGELLE